MHQKYRIGEVAALLGISAQTLRYYEDEGLVRPEKRDGSAYRYYSGWDLILLSTYRHYRAFEFTLEDSNALLHAESTHAVLDTLRRQELALEEKIRAYQQMLSTIRAWREEACATQALIGQYRVERNVRTWLLPFQEQEQLCRDEHTKQQLARWYACIPYVYTGLTCTCMPGGRAPDTYRMNLCLADVALPFLGISDRDGLVEFPETDCLHTAFQLDEAIFCSGEPFLRMHEQAAVMGLKLQGQFICRLNLTCSNDGQIRSLADCFAPLAH